MLAAALQTAVAAYLDAASRCRGRCAAPPATPPPPAGTAAGAPCGACGSAARPRRRGTADGQPARTAPGWPSAHPERTNSRTARTVSPAGAARCGRTARVPGRRGAPCCPRGAAARWSATKSSTSPVVTAVGSLVTKAKNTFRSNPAASALFGWPRRTADSHRPARVRAAPRPPTRPADACTRHGIHPATRASFRRPGEADRTR